MYVLIDNRIQIGILILKLELPIAVKFKKKPRRRSYEMYLSMLLMN